MHKSEQCYLQGRHPETWRTLWQNNSWAPFTRRSADANGKYTWKLSRHVCECVFTNIQQDILVSTDRTCSETEESWKQSECCYLHAQRPRVHGQPHERLCSLAHAQKLFMPACSQRLKIAASCNTVISPHSCFITSKPMLFEMKISYMLILRVPVRSPPGSLTTGFAVMPFERLEVFYAILNDWKYCTVFSVNFITSNTMLFEMKISYMPILRCL